MIQPTARFCRDTSGYIHAQSICVRNEDFNPVVLHGTSLSIFQRKMYVERLGVAGDYWDIWYDYTNSYVSPDAEVGTLLASYDITGLPVDAFLVDIDQANYMYIADPMQDVFYVLDQTHGGVYAIVPEPATMGLLGMGLAGLIARRRKQRS